MNIFEIIAGVLLIITSIFIIIMVILQDSNQNGMSGAVTGGSSDSYLGKNKGRTRDAQLKKLTRLCAIVFFVLTVLVSVFSRFVK